MMTVKGILSSEVWVNINQDTGITSHSTVNSAMICDHTAVHWIPAFQQMDSAADRDVVIAEVHNIWTVNFMTPLRLSGYGL